MYVVPGLSAMGAGIAADALVDGEQGSQGLLALGIVEAPEMLVACLEMEEETGLA